MRSNSELGQGNLYRPDAGIDVGFLLNLRYATDDSLRVDPLKFIHVCFRSFHS